MGTMFNKMRKKRELDVLVSEEYELDHGTMLAQYARFEEEEIGEYCGGF